jgi:SulP family sulfate permease
MRRFVPSFVRDLAVHRPSWGDVQASVAVTFMAVPQGVAYAMIAGLPPAMGLYAAVVPAAVGSLFRSSRHVVTGPTNAVSLLVGTAILATGGDPVTVALQLAVMVGVVQAVAGLLRLGLLVDYVSGAVVLGYITGAAVLILVGQLPNLTGSPGGSGFLYGQVTGWLSGLGQIGWGSVALGVGAMLIVALQRRFAPRAPGPVLALALALAVSWAVDLRVFGVRLVGDLAPIPAALPPFGLPDLTGSASLLSVAFAITVLSFVESSSVARSIAGKTGDRLDMSTELFGTGLANVAAGVAGGYPVSGSLSRSAFNVASGATSRLSGVLAGGWMVLVLLVGGPLLDRTPIPALAGLLVIVAWDLLDFPRLRAMVRGTSADRFALVGTLIGAFTLPLDQAIYLGIVISLVLFLRRARLVHDSEMRVDGEGRLVALDADDDDAPAPCGAVRILHVEGDLFFGAASALEGELDRATEDEAVRVLIVRLKRAHNLDLTSLEVFVRAATRMKRAGRRLLFVGLKPAEMDLLQRTGLIDTLGRENLFPTQARWFLAMEHAVAYALEIAGPHDDADGACPLQGWVARRRAADASREQVGETATQ